MWLISCTLFVFLALMEYFVVLFSIRYEKHWRTIKAKPPPPLSQSQPSQLILPSSSTNTSQTDDMVCTLYNFPLEYCVFIFIDPYKTEKEEWFGTGSTGFFCNE